MLLFCTLISGHDVFSKYYLNVLKVCNKCGKEKSIEEFGFYNKKLKKRRNTCIDCVAAYYVENKPVFQERSKKKRQSDKEFVHSYLAGRKCIDCGESDPTVLEFDHRDNEENASKLTKQLAGDFLEDPASKLR